MRISMHPGDPAFERTQWIRQSGAKIVVLVNGEVVEGADAADEETGVVCRRRHSAMGGVIGPDGKQTASFLGPMVTEFLRGVVEIKISLRD